MWSLVNVAQTLLAEDSIAHINTGDLQSQESQQANIFELPTVEDSQYSGRAQVTPDATRMHQTAGQAYLLDTVTQKASPDSPADVCKPTVTPTGSIQPAWDMHYSAKFIHLGCKTLLLQVGMLKQVLEEQQLEILRA